MSGTAAEAKYRGVRKRKWGKYVCEIRLPNSRERIWLGSYDAAEKAARAFDAALFCLRGRAAKFNFPDDPPDIPGGESLSPSEIQAVAQRYGKSYGSGRLPQAAEDGFRARASEDSARVDLIDGSFWEMVDMNGGHNADFGPFPEPDEMYSYAHYEARVCEDEDEISYDDQLWNF
ncbi:ethylene-responsive transcription factor ERF017-like [Salvia miltiorrhiza]|uniref:ethylene-responsive transcription factor ERF017-like n=1 Tax=Salvia miltiorrhiza TaxID=226208 RepID=UPI0025AD27D9|nr:ethylene-responsive transcription factor ERF017-like [Salvia miltiorrhiza]XP_057811853.1 ethylene-responsive transcription factor ERF017-like [Salvia miltiorrhiza]